MKVALNSFQKIVWLQKFWTAATTSLLTISQQLVKNSMVNPSGPGAYESPARMIAENPLFSL